MAPIKWDAFRSLNITNRESNGMTCVGNTKYGKRCRWDISNSKFNEIRSLLEQFETQAPVKALSSLKRLARLSLCEDWHQGQAFEKVDEWEVAIGDATKFYEAGRDLKERNQELKEMWKGEKLMREGVEEALEQELSQKKMNLKTIRSMELEMSSMKAKTKQATTEARRLEETAQKVSKDQDRRVAKMQSRISINQILIEKLQDTITTLHNEMQAIRSVRSELENSKSSEKVLLAQVSELTAQLNIKCDANNELQVELIQVKSELELALSQRNELETQLQITIEKNTQVGFSLQEAEAAKEELAVDKERLHTQLNIELQNSNNISHAKAQLEDQSTGLRQELKTLNTQLLSERQNTAELQQSLQTATENLAHAHGKLSTIEGDFSRNKDELERLLDELARARDESQVEQQQSQMLHEASLAREEQLAQEIAYAKLHPLRTFFANLFALIKGWVRLIYAYCGRIGTRKAPGLPITEVNGS